MAMGLRLTLIQFLYPNISHIQLGDGLELNSKISGLVVRGGRVVVNEHGHDLPVHNVNAGSTARDDGVFVPIVRLYRLAQLPAVADGAHELLPIQAMAFDHLTPPGNDSHRSVLGIKLTRINLAGPEISLRTGHHPIEVHRANVRHDLGGKPRPRNARLASVLKTAASISDDLHLELQVKVPGFKPSINKIGVAAGIFGGGLADDRASFNFPEFWVSVPALQADAIKQGNVTFVVVKIHGAGFVEARMIALFGRAGYQALAIGGGRGRLRDGKRTNRKKQSEPQNENGGVPQNEPNRFQVQNAGRAEKSCLNGGSRAAFQQFLRCECVHINDCVHVGRQVKRKTL